MVLATAIVEKLRQHYPESTIDFLLRKGNESLLDNNPNIRRLLVFNKKEGKYRNLVQMIRQIRQEKYDYVINAQRFLAAGLMTAFSGAKHTIGFDKNPLSFRFSQTIPHHISATDKDNHEVKRNLALIEKLTDSTFVKPKLYPSEADFKKTNPAVEYICIAPASVWFTKQFPPDKWVALIHKIPEKYTIYLMGAKSDFELSQWIKSKIQNPKSKIINISGQLSFLESAALMKHARMNFVNDSAPLHFASAVNAPVCAIFCSTVPAFGFGPLSDTSYVFETAEKLDCRPCGLHGYRSCPKGHFRCSYIDTEILVSTIFPQSNA